MRISDILLRLHALFSPRRVERELDEELAFHLEMQAKKNIAAGMSADEARRHARLQFGGVENAKEECRDARGLRAIDALTRNIRYAFRGFRRTPGFTAVALLALMLGIGANTAIFSVVYAVLLAPLPYPNPDQLVMVWSKVNDHRARVSAPDFLDWKRQNSVFQDIGAWNGSNFNLSTSTRPEVVQARLCTPGLLNLQGIPFAMGRDFVPDDAVPGKDHVAILTNLLWRQHFGSDPNIIGREIRLDGQPYTVVGVFAAGMADRFESQVMLPLAFNPEQLRRDQRRFAVMARLKPGVTLQQANAEMDVVTRRLTDAYPASNTGWGISVESLHHDFTDRDTIRGLWLLMGSVGFLLLIACLNVANLLLARGTVREKEVAVRASLGATRFQLFSQFLTESLTLAVIGGILGVAFAWIMLKAVVAILPPFSIPTEADVRLNVAVLLFSLATTVLAGIVCGCAPAWRSSRWNVSDALKLDGRSSQSSGRHGVRRSLVVVEFALALTLLTGAGLAVHSFWKLMNVDLGFREDNVLTFSLNIPSTQLTQSEQMIGFYRQLLDRIRAVPGVVSASASTGMPLRGTSMGLPFNIAGESVNDAAFRPTAGFTMVTPEYFRTLGIEIIKGRAFTEQDANEGPPVAIVNETFASKYLGQNPLTQQVTVDRPVPGSSPPGPRVNWQVVGVYRNVRNGGIRSEGFPEINVPFWQSPSRGAMIQVRTTGDPAGMINSVTSAVASVNPDLGLNRLMTMEEVVEDSMGSDRFATIFLATFGVMALVLSVIGIYGVMSFAVVQRTHEIGVRMALGAAPGQVLRHVLHEGLVLATVGLGVGLSGAYFVGRLMKSLLYEVAATDPPTIAAIVALLFGSALLACYIPARRATRVDPVVALRNQ